MAQIPPRAPAGLVWETHLVESGLYGAEVEALLKAYERSTGALLKPGSRKKVGLKVNTRSGRGLSTPRGLICALIDAPGT